MNKQFTSKIMAVEIGQYDDVSLTLDEEIVGDYIILFHIS